MWMLKVQKVQKKISFGNPLKERNKKMKETKIIEKKNEPMHTH